jgi:REP element-mobilizing transposase RayT
MKHPFAFYHRRSHRLPDYDYSSNGAYFITFCAENKQCLFGEIVDDEMILNEYGNIVQEELLKTLSIRREIELITYCVMPNHVHAVILLNDAQGDRPVAPTSTTLRPRSIGAFVAGYKSAVTKRINEIRNTPGLPVWQRNYYEHVIRDEADMSTIHDYIQANPAHWSEDKEYFQ